jgi:hypothetical protein
MAKAVAPFFSSGYLLMQIKKPLEINRAAFSFLDQPHETDEFSNSKIISFVSHQNQNS